MTTIKGTRTKPAAADAVLAALTSHHEATAAELAEAAGVGHSTASKALAALEAQGKAFRAPGRREGGRRLADRWTPARGRAQRSSHRDTPGPATAEGRLAKGALRAMVLEHLRRHRGQELTPSAVGKALGHSSGAVANALARLAADGKAVEVSTAPRRYAVRN